MTAAAPTKLTPSQASIASRKKRIAAMTPDELAAWRAYQVEASIRSQRVKKIREQLEQLLAAE